MYVLIIKTKLRGQEITNCYSDLTIDQANNVLLSFVALNEKEVISVHLVKKN